MLNKKIKSIVTNCLSVAMVLALSYVSPVNTINSVSNQIRAVDTILAPDGLRAMVVDHDKVLLTWKTVENAKYNVYRTVEDGESVLIASDLEDSSYVDTNACDKLTNVKYYVSAVVNYVESNKSNDALVETFCSMVDDRDSRVMYSTGWSDWDASENYNGTIKYIQNPVGEETATLTFYGTGIELIACTNTAYGLYEVYIDGVSQGDVDTYSETVQRQKVVFSKNDLIDGKHTIKVVVKNEKNPASTHTKVELDGFRILTDYIPAKNSPELDTNVKFIYKYTPSDGSESGIMASQQNRDHLGDYGTLFDGSYDTGVILRWKLGANYSGDYWTNGDYVGVEFEKTISLGTVTMSTKGNDRYASSKLEYQKSDGSWVLLKENPSWTNIDGVYSISYTADQLYDDVKAIRLVYTGTGAQKWVNLDEIVVTPYKIDLNSDVIDPSNMSVMAGNYEKNGGANEGPASLVLDNNTNTHWHTEFGGTTYRTNHYLMFTFNENKAYDLHGVKLQQRQGTSTVNGVVTEFKVYVTQDENAQWTTEDMSKWNEVVSDGTMTRDKGMQTTRFNEIRAKKVVVKVENSISDPGDSRIFSALSEVRFLGGEAKPAPNVTDEEGRVILRESTKLGLMWNKVSNADSYIVIDEEHNIREEVNSNMIILSGLTPATKYNFKIFPKNLGGEAENYISIVNANTVNPFASKVTNLEGLINSSTLTGVTWTAPENVDIKYYIVYLNGQACGTADSTMFNFDNALGKGSYEIGVVAVNTDGYKSELEHTIVLVKAKPNEDGSYDRTLWTGAAFSSDGREEASENDYNDGVVEYMFDSNAITSWHTSYSEGDSDQAPLPVYVFIDFSEELDFNAFGWESKEKNAVNEYEFYINVTDENLIPDDSTSSYTDLQEGWQLVKYSGGTEGLKTNANNKVKLDSTYSANQVMMKILSVHGHDSTAHVTCKNFNIYLEDTELVKPNIKYSNAILNDDYYVRESFYTSYMNGELLNGDAVLEDVTTYTNAVIKYVPKSVLSIKAQSEKFTDEKGMEKVNVRFISSVPSANLDRLSFKVEILDDDGNASKTAKVYTNKAYGAIVADGVSITDAKNVFDNQVSEYFFLCKLNNIPTSQRGTKIKVTPYWLPYGCNDIEANYVEGVSRIFDVGDFVDNAATVIKEE